MSGELAAVLQLPDGPISYLLRRSPRSRNLRVTIDPQRGVIVTLPLGTRRGWASPERLVEEFLREREAWLRRHLGRLAHERERIAAHGGLDEGGRIRFRGELHRLSIAPSSTAIRRSLVAREGTETGDELVIRLAAGDRRVVPVVLRDWLQDRARIEIDREIERHAAALRVTPASITLRDPRTRWGSASREGRLSFSWRLVLAPPEALETVVVHELAHLRYFGHGPRFWGLVATRRPDHREWRRWLRRHSLELHSALEAPATNPETA